MASRGDVDRAEHRGGEAAVAYCAAVRATLPDRADSANSNRPRPRRASISCFRSVGFRSRRPRRPLRSRARGSPAASIMVRMRRHVASRAPVRTASIVLAASGSSKSVCLPNIVSSLLVPRIARGSRRAGSSSQRNVSVGQIQFGIQARSWSQTLPNRVSLWPCRSRTRGTAHAWRRSRSSRSRSASASRRGSSSMRLVAPPATPTLRTMGCDYGQLVSRASPCSGPRLRHDPHRCPVRTSRRAGRSQERIRRPPLQRGRWARSLLEWQS